MTESTFDDLIFYHKSNIHFIKNKIIKNKTPKQNDNDLNKNKLDRIKTIQSISINPSFHKNNKQSNHCLFCTESIKNINKLQKENKDLKKEIVDINKNNDKQCEELINGRNDILKLMKKEQSEKDKLLEKIQDLKYENNMKYNDNKYNDNEYNDNKYNHNYLKEMKRIKRLNNDLKELISNNLSNNSNYSEIELMLKMELDEIINILNQLKLSKNINDKLKNEIEIEFYEKGEIIKNLNEEKMKNKQIENELYRLRIRTKRGNENETTL